MDKNKAYLLKPDKQPEEIAPNEIAVGFTLEECYVHLNCDTIELIYLPENLIMIVDEEGVLKSNPIINGAATGLSRVPIVGNAIICPKRMFK